jgi:hypothetical protein
MQTFLFISFGVLGFTASILMIVLALSILREL